MRPLLAISAAAALALTVLSCSPTRKLQEGEYRLWRNVIAYTGEEPDEEVVGSMASYIRQQPGSFIKRAGEEEVVYDSSLVGISIRNLETHLEYVGYFGSKVTASTSFKKKNATVRYDITLGRRYPIHSIDVILPDNPSFREAFAADSANITIHPGDFLSEALVDRESDRSARYLRNAGYYGFNKNYYSFEADTVKVPHEACLKMILSERARGATSDRTLTPSTVRSVTISYPSSYPFREKILREINGIIPGAPYSEKDVDNTYSRLSQVKAFSGVRIRMDQVDSVTLDCAIDLTPARTHGFRIDLEGSTNSSRLIGISPQLSYYNRNFFRGGEQLTLGFLGNFQFNLSDKSQYARELGTSVGIRFPRLLFFPLSLFRGPNLPYTDFSVAYSYQDRPEYMRNTVSASFGYTGRWNERLSYQIIPVRLNLIRMHNVDSEFAASLEGNPYLQNAYLDHFDLGETTALSYTTNSSAFPRTSYHYWRIQFDSSGNLLSLLNPMMKLSEGSRVILGTPYSQYSRIEGTIGRTWTFGRGDGQAIATRFTAGIGFAYGNSGSLPFEKQFYGGGASSLRGWQARAVGPGTAKMYDIFKLPSQTGDLKLEANIEYRFKLFSFFHAATFIDAGNVWDYDMKGLASTSVSENENLFRFKSLPESVAVNWGLGLRLDFSMVLLRLDMGLQLRNPSRDGSKWVAPKDWFGDFKGYAIHFGVGYPF